MLHPPEDNPLVCPSTCGFSSLSPLRSRSPPTPTSPARSRRRSPPPQYASHDTHEQITIAADPGDTKDSAPHTRLDYLAHGFMPIRIIVTNDSSQPLSLDDARILLVAANDVSENAASQEELERGTSSVKNQGKKIPLPGGLPPVTERAKPVDNQIVADDNDFGFKSSTIAPHSTAAGWLYYDVRDLGSDPQRRHRSSSARSAGPPRTRLSTPSRSNSSHHLQRRPLRRPRFAH